MRDLIDRAEAIDALEKQLDYLQMLNKNENPKAESKWYGVNWARNTIADLPSAQPTLYGYNIEHLELIARVLRKEDLPPERVVEALTDIGRIVAIVRDKFEETLRRAVQNIERRTDE